MAIHTATPFRLYPTERAVLDQIANNNIPFSRDFAFTYQTPEIELAAEEELDVVLPLVYLPATGSTPTIQYMLKADILIRTMSEVAGTESFATSVQVVGTTANTTTVVTETPAVAPLVIAAEALTDKLDWNAYGQEGAHSLNLTITPTVSLAACSQVVEVCVLGVHLMLG